MRKIDAAVVGAGAVGCIAAKELACRGLETVVFEEHSRPGKFGKCTGLVSTRGLEALHVNYKHAVVSRVSGAAIHSPHFSFEVRRKNVAAVLDRQRFDEECAAEAVDAGAAIRYGSRVIGFSRKKEENGKNETRVVTGNDGKKRFAARFIIGADGAQSPTAAARGFPPLEKLVLCCEKEFPRARVCDEEKVEVFVDNKLYPGFFAWIVPAGGGARIGFGTTRFDLAPGIEKKFFEKKEVRDAVGARKPKKSYWAVIPLAAREKTQAGNVLLVGDAAGQVKATTGGGIVFGGLCARIAAECVAESVVNKEPPRYEERWRDELGAVLRVHSFARRCADAAPNPLLDFFTAAANFGPAKLLDWFGDMDFILR